MGAGLRLDFRDQLSLPSEQFIGRHQETDAKCDRNTRFLRVRMLQALGFQKRQSLQTDANIG